MSAGTDLCQKRGLAQRTLSKWGSFLCSLGEDNTSVDRKSLDVNTESRRSLREGRPTLFMHTKCTSTLALFLGSLYFISVGHRRMKLAFSKYVIAQSFCHSVDPTLHSRHCCTFPPTHCDISLAFRAASFIHSSLSVKCGLQACWAQFFMLLAKLSAN